MVHNAILQKSILVIGIGFYDYENAIIDELKKRYFKVYYINAVYNSILKRILLHLSNNLSKKVEATYLRKKILNLPNDIDDILIIKGENFEEQHIQLLKKKYSQANICLYLWDSLNRIRNASLLLRNFDNIFTFDRKDAIRYNLKLRPLFYRNNECVCNKDYKYDISFIGWMHSQRYEILHKLKKQLNEQNIKYKFVLYTGKLSYFINRYIRKKIKKEDKDLFVFHPISYHDYLSISLSSKVILDIAHPLQSGLTMRTIEAIGLNKKILTTNPDIINYPMINKDNYVVLDMDNIIIDQSIFDKSSKYNATAYFSLSAFVDEILPKTL